MRKMTDPNHCQDTGSVGDHDESDSSLAESSAAISNSDASDDSSASTEQEELEEEDSSSSSDESSSTTTSASSSALASQTDECDSTTADDDKEGEKSDLDAPDLPKTELDRYAACVLRLTSSTTDGGATASNNVSSLLPPTGVQVEKADKQVEAFNVSEESSHCAPLVESRLPYIPFIPGAFSIPGRIDESRTPGDRMQTTNVDNEESMDEEMQNGEEGISGVANDEENDEDVEAPGVVVWGANLHGSLTPVIAPVKEGGGEPITIAQAVDVTENSTTTLQEAVQVDLKSTYLARTRQRRLRGRYVGFLSMVLIAAVGLALTWFALRTLNASSSNRHHNRSQRERLGIRELVESVVGAQVLNASESPYAKALEWIVYNDPKQAAPDYPGFLQRYMAAYFYFATTVDRPWKACNAPTASQSDSCIFPLHIYRFDGSPTVTNIDSIRWLTNYDVCYWVGIVCDENKQVQQIELGGADMSGTFPLGIKHFSFLQKLSIGYGTLHGTLPTEIVSMKHLQGVYMQNHQFTGEIPLEWWQSSRNLNSIDLSGNLISGSIPSAIQFLPEVRTLALANNQIEGTIPSEIGHLANLDRLTLYNNMLSGTIPSLLGGKMISMCNLDKNRLTGTIPSEIGVLSNLVILTLAQNFFSGVLPDELWSLSSLDRLDLNDCNLTGTLSPRVANLSDKITILKCNNNHFYGSIPTEIGLLQKLNVLQVSGNDFVGSMPEEICLLRGEYRLQLLRADCAPNTLGEAEILCDDACCTICCDVNGDYCSETGG